MDFHCINCKVNLSDTDNTALCSNCTSIILPFYKFINKEKDNGDFSALKSYEMNKNRLIAKGITESGLDYILNYCKCIDENDLQHTNTNNQQDNQQELLIKNKKINKRAICFLIIGIVISIIILIMILSPDFNTYYDSFQIILYIIGSIGIVILLISLLYISLQKKMSKTNIKQINKLSISNNITQIKSTISKYCLFIGIILIILGGIFSSSEKYESSSILYPVIIGFMAFIGLVMFITSILFLAFEGTKEQEKAEKNRINQLAIVHGFKEFTQTAGNNIFAIDEINGIWHGTYIRNMDTYTRVEKLTVITGYSIEPVYNEKHNSLGRAVAGGILFGTTGAIIGALTSSNKQVLTNDCYLTISTNLHDYGTQRYQMKTFVGKNIVSTLDILYDAKKLGTTPDIKLSLIENTETQENYSSKKLFELKTLFEQNLITNEEYAKKRKEIIDKL